MEIDLPKINELLSTGLSMPKIESQLGVGKDTLRKKLNKLGYHFDKTTRQYIKDSLVNDPVPTARPKERITSIVADSDGGNESSFSPDEVQLLHEMIKEYQLRKVVSSAAAAKGDLINRNVRVYKNQFDAFASFCKANNITQADALYKAIELLMNEIR